MVVISPFINSGEVSFPKHRLHVVDIFFNFFVSIGSLTIVCTLPVILSILHDAKILQYNASIKHKSRNNPYTLPSINSTNNNDPIKMRVIIPSTSKEDFGRNNDKYSKHANFLFPLSLI